MLLLTKDFSRKLVFLERCDILTNISRKSTTGYSSINLKKTGPTTCEMFVKAFNIFDEEYDKSFFEPQRVRSLQILRFTYIYCIDTLIKLIQMEVNSYVLLHMIRHTKALTTCPWSCPTFAMLSSQFLLRGFPSIYILNQKR